MVMKIPGSFHLRVYRGLEGIQGIFLEDSILNYSEHEEVLGL